MKSKNYWCYRIDKNKRQFFLDELKEGRLRQGWGWDSKQDLRNLKMDEGARRNKPMYDKVKKGDILLVPRLPDWNGVAVVEATEDWNKGYRFEIADGMRDYGHIFPAKYIKHFSRKNENVSGNLRATLKNVSRFWSVVSYSEDIEKILSAEQDGLISNQSHSSRLEAAIGSIFEKFFNEEEFSKALFDEVSGKFSHAEWEDALVHGIKKLFPYYEVTKEGGRQEKEHGTDILIMLPSIIPDYKYAIAIQVKDYKDYVSGRGAIEQINKAEKWNSDQLKLIDRIIVLTGASKERNSHLIENDSDVKIMFADDLKTLLARIGKRFINQFLD